MARLFSTVLIFFIASCSGGGRDDGAVAGRAAADNRADAVLLAAAAKRSVVPTQSQIDGEAEPRFGGATTVQNFHLGGFGVGPLQNFPDPINVDLTEPAGAPVYFNEKGRPEETWLRLMMLVDPASGVSVVFVTLDAVGAGNNIQNNLKAAISEVTGIAPDNILFGQTHSHAGADLQGLWGGVPQSWIDELYAKAAAAAVQAQAELQPVLLEYRQSELEQFNNYRRPRVFRDIDADTTATVLQAVTPASGKPVGTLLQYNAHPTSIGAGEDPRIPHPDYILGAVEHLEQAGGVALYFNGSIADASGSGGSCDGSSYIRVRCRGQELAAAAMEAEALVLPASLSVRHATAYLPITNPLFLAVGVVGSFNRYYNFTELPLDQVPGLGDQFANLPQLAPYAVTTVSRVTIGDTLEIVTMPGEVTNTFGEYIQALAGDRPMMLLGLTHNSFGYIIPEEEFSYIDETGDAGFTLPFTSYEEYVSLGPLTAPLLRIQAYAPLFDASPERYAPPSLVACYDPSVGDLCIVEDILARPDYIQRGYHKTCVENLGEDNPVCELIAPSEG